MIIKAQNGREVSIDLYGTGGSLGCLHDWLRQEYLARYLSSSDEILGCCSGVFEAKKWKAMVHIKVKMPGK